MKLKISNISITATLLTLSLGISSCYAHNSGNQAMKISASSNGRYIISSYTNKKVVLWDTKKNSHTLISSNGNPFSAYFIKNSNYYMWQSLDKNDRINWGGYITGNASESSVEDSFNYKILYHAPGAMLSSVENNNLIIVTREKNNYYLYFPFNNKAGYKKIHVTKDTLNYKNIVSLFKDPNIIQAFKPSFSFGGRPNQYFYFGAIHKINQLARSYGWNAGNKVHIDNIAGKTIMQFNNFPVYSQIMTANLKNYYSSDNIWNLYSGHGNKQIKKLDSALDINTYPTQLSDLEFYTDLSYYNEDRPTLGLAVSPNGKYILSYGDAANIADPKVKPFYLTLWSTHNNKIIHLFKPGLFSKTKQVFNNGTIHAAFSPDNNYIVAGDKNGGTIIWNLHTYQRSSAGNDLKDLATIEDSDVKGAKVPDALRDSIDYEVKNLKFIDNTHYLVFVDTGTYALLFKIGDFYPIKYLNLGATPTKVDTSPSTKTLFITTNNEDNGISTIIKYKYNSSDESLQKVWQGELD